MPDHIPSPPDMEAPIQPDHAQGAWTNCECSLCRERRLLDDCNNFYTPHDMVDAFTRGYINGWHTSRRYPHIEEPR